jgi:two-component system LytT family sensor kinase
MGLRLSISAIYKKHQFVFYHILAWLIYISLNGLYRIIIYGHEAFNIIGFILTNLPNICAFYAAVFIYFRLLVKGRYLWLIVFEPLAYVSYVLFYYFIYYKLTPLFIPHAAKPNLKLDQFIISSLWFFLLYSYFALGYYFAIKSVLKERQMAAIAREKILAQQGQLEAEYAFLRAQISPHFLHNTLNFFYAKSLSISAELSDGILTLCDILRYAFEADDGSGTGTVLLTREVEHMENVIHINQLRFSNRLVVNLDITGNLERVRIIPLVLNTMVENAFKHGELTNKSFPLTIRLSIGEGGKSLFFSISNKKKTGPKERSHGVGMDNIGKRLFAAYKKDFTLQVRDEGDQYEVTLEVHFADEMTQKEINLMAN